MRERIDRFILRGLFADTNVEADPGTGGAKFSVDDDGVQVWPYAKLAWGASGTQTEVAAGASAIPIQDGGNAITVDGSVTVSATNLDIRDLSSASDSVAITDGGGSITVDGSVTANAGTNLNTSALALEAGGNLAAIAASASVLDDWDESDRAKVNVIVGQAGIAGGTGTDGATVPRVTLATNVPLPTGTNSIGNIGTVAVVTTAAVTNAGTFAVQNNGTGKTLKTASGTLTADTDVVAAVSTKRIKVYGYTMFNVSTSADLLIFKSNGTTGTELWRTLLQGATGSPMGSNLAVTPPAFLFATVAGEKLTLDVSAGDTIHYSLAYWDDDVS